MPNLGPEIGDRLPQGLQLSPPRYKTAKDLKATDPLADLEAKEQDDLAKDAAEYDAILPQNDGRPAIDTSAMAMDISRKEVLHRRDQNITACDATKTERLPIEVFNDLLSTGATVGIPKASDQSRAGIRILFAGASGSGKSVAAAKLIGKNSENIPKIKTIFYGYTNAKGRVIQIIDTVGDPVFHTGTSSYYKEADHCILFSDKYLSQEDLSLFKPTTCFKRFKNQEDLKEYLDCL
jgi:hypothetical protein